MTNPYEPPNREVRYLPIWTRIYRATRAAIREYRNGLAREQFTTFQHIHAWVSLLLVGFLLLLMFVTLGFALIYMIRSV
jgi:hypothetical protein